MNNEDINDDDRDDGRDDERTIDEDGADQSTFHQDDTDSDDRGRYGAPFGPQFGPGFLDALKDFAEYSGFDLGGRRGGPGQRGPGERGPGHRSHDGPGRRGGPGERGGRGERGGYRGPGPGGPGGRGGHRGPGGPGGRGRGGRSGDFGGFPGGPGRPQRARKGDVRAAILSLLAEEPHNGYRLIKAIARMTGGAWRPSPGSVYPTLQQMLEEGLIAAVGGDGNRSDYGLTDEGRSYVAEHVQDLKAAWEAASGTTDEDLAMQDSIRKLIGAVRQAALAAGEEQSGKIAEILDDARRAVYRVLAD